MARESNQKLKIMYLLKIFLEETDDRHYLTMNRIIEMLAQYGVAAERKSIYDDIEKLRMFGIDIIGEPMDRDYCYYVGSRDFELAELKLLVDSVQSAKFITQKKSTELIKKLCGLASRHDAGSLHRQVYVAGRVKTMNESIYYNVDLIHDAINSNVEITFQYFQWNMHKEMELKHDGRLYQVSPWSLMWDDENYYLVAFDSAENKIKHFRVDKMLHISLTSDRRKGRTQYMDMDMAAYAKKMFAMFDGEDERVRLRCTNNMANVLIDRFGKDIRIVKEDDEHFIASVNVAFSNHFIGWVLALGSGIEVIGPDEAVQKVRDEVKRLSDTYLN